MTTLFKSVVSEYLFLSLSFLFFLTYKGNGKLVGSFVIFAALGLLPSLQEKYMFCWCFGVSALALVGMLVGEWSVKGAGGYLVSG